MDENGYPTVETLERIQKWPHTDFMGLAKFICEIWWYREYAKLRGRTLELSTGGWSGNESLLSELDSHIFGMVCWESSRRGGHHVYKIPKII